MNVHEAVNIMNVHEVDDAFYDYEHSDVCSIEIVE